MSDPSSRDYWIDLRATYIKQAKTFRSLAGCNLASVEMLEELAAGLLHAIRAIEKEYGLRPWMPEPMPARTN